MNRFALLASDLRYVLDYKGPGHEHDRPGIWDTSGKPCNHCARLAAARTNLAVFETALGRRELCGCSHTEGEHRRQRPGWTREACSLCDCVDYVKAQEGSGIRGLLAHVGIDTTGRDIRVGDKGPCTAEAPVERCPSCDHEVAYHDVDGRCWFTVDQGVVGSNLVCPCDSRRDEGGEEYVHGGRPAAESMDPGLREVAAEALMRWAEGNHNPQYAHLRRSETVRENAYSRADAVLAALLDGRVVLTSQVDRDRSAALARVRRLHDRLNEETALTSPEGEITRGAAAKKIAAALDGWTPPPSAPASLEESS